MNKRHLILNAMVCAALLTVFGQASAQSVAMVEVAVPDLLLAKVLPAQINVPDYLISEKYDGVRAFWDGRVLRFRGGGLVAAPVWFTAALPAVPLDGELWVGRGQFEAVSGIVRSRLPVESDWRRVKYLIFELPNAVGSFAERAVRIESVVAAAAYPQLVAVKQFRLNSRAQLQSKLDEVVNAGGEGLMLHLGSAPYETGRSSVLYKLKPREDAEATVVGHLAGQGKYAELVGALRVLTADGRAFNLGTGLSDDDRHILR